MPNGIRLVYLPPHSPELQPAETLWPLVDEPIVNKLVPSLDDLVNTTGTRRCDVTERQTEISSPTNFAW